MWFFVLAQVDLHLYNYYKIANAIRDPYSRFLSSHILNPVQLFSALFSRTLTAAWSFSCGGTLWRLLLGDRGSIVGECRDQEKKETTFFCLNCETGSLAWTYSSAEERWWLGLEAVCRNRALIHGFESPDLPGHKRLLALDLGNGAEVWRNDDVTYWFSYQSRVYAYRTTFEKRIAEVLDLETGELLESHEALENLTAVRNLARQEDPHASIEFPELLDPAGTPSKFRTLIEREIRDHRVVGQVEAVVKEPFLVMNYHRMSKGSTPEKLRLENQFLIFDSGSGKKVYSDLLAQDAHAPVPDAFFVKDSSVYFIKDQKNLCMVRLPLTESPRV